MVSPLYLPFNMGEAAIWQVRCTWLPGRDVDTRSYSASFFGAGLFLWSNMSDTRALLSMLIDAIDEGEDFDVVVIARDHGDNSLNLIANVWDAAKDELIAHAVAITRGQEH